MGLYVLIETELVEVFLLVGSQQHQHIIRRHLLLALPHRAFYRELPFFDGHQYVHPNALHIEQMVAALHREEFLPHFCKTNAAGGERGQLFALYPSFFLLRRCVRRAHTVDRLR